MNTASNMPYKHLNIRQLQAYAALCLREYCKSLNISHVEIDVLVNHLFSILLSDDLPGWEQTGSCLILHGRGDPVPEEIERVIPSKNLDGFHKIVEYCIEVGIIDMYGAPTTLPLEFLEKCLAILSDFRIDPPSVNAISKLRQNGEVWGQSINASQYQHLVDHYQIG